MVNNALVGGYGYFGLAFLLVSTLVFVLALIAVCSRKAWRRRAAVAVLQQILTVSYRRCVGEWHQALSSLPQSDVDKCDADVEH